MFICVVIYFQICHIIVTTRDKETAHSNQRCRRFASSNRAQCVFQHLSCAAGQLTAPLRNCTGGDVVVHEEHAEGHAHGQQRQRGISCERVRMQGVWTPRCCSGAAAALTATMKCMNLRSMPECLFLFLLQQVRSVRERQLAVPELVRILAAALVY